MPAAIRWGNSQKTIIVFEVERNTGWGEIAPLMDEYVVMMQSVPHRVHLIYHFVEGTYQLPPMSFSAIRRFYAYTQPNEDKSVFAGHVPLLEMVTRAVGHTFGLEKIRDDWWFVKTLDEAYQRLAAYEQERSAKDGG